MTNKGPDLANFDFKALGEFWYGHRMTAVLAADPSKGLDYFIKHLKEDFGLTREQFFDDFRPILEDLGYGAPIKHHGP